jgi:hypothetical protein
MLFLNILKTIAFCYKKLTKTVSKKHENHWKWLNQYLGKIETLIINKYWSKALISLKEKISIIKKYSYLLPKKISSI